MVFDFAFRKPIARAVLLVAVIFACLFMGQMIVRDFVIGALTDDRGGGAYDDLRAVTRYFPDSARLNQKLAEAEFSAAERYETEPESHFPVSRPSLAAARVHALRAVELSPHNHNAWLTLSSIEEATGSRSEAERDLAMAKELAPADARVNWRHANLLLREGKFVESVPAFRIAVDSN